MDSKKIFISFSSKNQVEADRVCAFLERNGYSCFISSRDLVAGQEYAGQLIDNISSSTAVVLMLSKDSNESPHVLREVEYAVGKRIPIIVYCLEEVALSKSMEYYLMTHQWIPVNSDRNMRLLEGIASIVCGQPAAFARGRTSTASDRSLKLVLWVMAALIILVVGIIVSVVLFSDRKEISGGPIKVEKNEPTAKPTKEAEPTSAETSAPTKDAGEVKLGATVVFGTYLKTPIVWQVFDFDKESMTLVSRDLLSMKCFDAAEGGEYGFYDGVDYFLYENREIDDPELLVKVRGNNDWSRCNLRTWLNSDEKSVNYEDQAPSEHAVFHNPYDEEPGFLYEFTSEEKEALIPVRNKTNVNQFNEEAIDGSIVTYDLVYLPASYELKQLDKAGITLYPSPNKACIDSDQNPEGYSAFNKLSGLNSYYWWLRDTSPLDKVNMAYMAVTELEEDISYTSDSVGSNSYGVRPVIRVSLESKAYTIK